MSGVSPRPEQSTTAEITALTNLTALAASGVGEFIRKTGSTTFENAAAGAGSGATTALDNLSSVAINASLVLGTSDAFALGSATKMWSDLFLADGGVINFNAGNVTLTHSTGLLTSSASLSLGVSNVFTTGTIELGHASDTTLARIAAGRVSIEGVEIATISGSQTLTSKTLTSPIISAINDSNNQAVLALAGSLGADAYLTVRSSTSYLPTLEATSPEADVSIGIKPKGTGRINLMDPSSGISAILNTDSLATSDKTFTFPNASGTLYVTGGTDVSLADGGTGASLADPGADRVMFWDESANAVTWLTVGSGLTITDTTITASGGAPGGSDTQLQYNNSSAFGGITGATSDGTNLNVKDANFFVVDSSDATKKVAIEAGNVTAGQTRTITAVDANTTLIPWDLDTSTPANGGLNGVYRIRSSTWNFLSNSSFEYWLAGTSVAPSSWTLGGDATISRSSTAATGSYSAQIVFGTANTGELYQVVDTSTLVDYTFSCYVQRTAGTGTARLVAQRADAPYTEFASVSLSTTAGWQLAALTVKPSAGTQMRFAIKSADGVTSTWLIDECMFEESLGVATVWQEAYLGDTTTGFTIFGTPNFAGGLLIDQINEYTAAAGVTIDSVLHKDSSVLPSVSDAGALGSTALQWSDLFLASGGVINWAAGNVTLTHSTNTLTLSGGFVFNEAGIDVDCRIEGVSELNLFYTDAGNARVGIKTSTPNRTLEVNGTLRTSGSTRYRSDYYNDASGLHVNCFDDTGGVFQPIEYTGSTVNFLVGTGGGTQGLKVASSGRVGIGTASPSTLLELLGADNSTVQTIKINATQANVTAADTFMDFRSTTGSEATIAGTAVAGVIAYNTFTGSHYTQIVDKTDLEVNMLLEAVGGKPAYLPTAKMETETYIVYEDDPAGGFEVDGQTGELKIDAEGNPMKKIIAVKKQKLTEKTYEASNKGQLFKSRVCSTKGSKAAIGVYGGTDKEGRDMILSLGTGYMIVANKGKNIDIGDYLIASDVKGAVEVQPDDIYRNNTVGKATENIVWKIGETMRTISVIYLGG